MQYKCDVCGKGIKRGLNVSHAKNRTHKVWKPNLKTVRVAFNGSTRKLRLCVKCLRRVKKETYKKTTPFIAADTLAMPQENQIQEKLQVKEEKVSKPKRAKKTTAKATKEKKLTKKSASVE